MEILQEENRIYAKTKAGDAELLYRIKGKTMSIYHTFVPEAERGKGLGERLANIAFEFAIKNKYKVSPDCSYIAHYLQKHKEMKKYSE